MPALFLLFFGSVAIFGLLVYFPASSALDRLLSALLLVAPVAGWLALAWRYFELEYQPRLIRNLLRAGVVAVCVAAWGWGA